MFWFCQHCHGPFECEGELGLAVVCPHCSAETILQPEASIRISRAPAAHPAPRSSPRHHKRGLTFLVLVGLAAILALWPRGPAYIPLINQSALESEALYWLNLNLWSHLPPPHLDETGRWVEQPSLKITHCSHLRYDQTRSVFYLDCQYEWSDGLWAARQFTFDRSGAAIKVKLLTQTPSDR